MFQTHYRIVTDRFAGFEAQYRPWWWPFWLECYGINTCPSLEAARALCDQHANNAHCVERSTPK